MDGRAKWKRAFINILLYSVFVFYILLLVLILFRQRHAVRSVNLIPLRGILAFFTGTDLATGGAPPLDPDFIRGLAVSNIGGNVAIFIPLGVYVTLFNRDKAIWKNTLLVVLVSVAVEAVQFTFKMGIGDIDDVLLNGIGGLLGVLLCRGIYLLCKEDRFKARCVVAVIAPAVGILSMAGLVWMNR